MTTTKEFGPKDSVGHQHYWHRSSGLAALRRDWELDGIRWTHNAWEKLWEKSEDVGKIMVKKNMRGLNTV